MAEQGDAILSCPKCGSSDSFASLETIRGNQALLNAITRDGEFEYFGETKVNWDDQEIDTDDNGNYLVLCRSCFSMWAVEHKTTVKARFVAPVTKEATDV